MSDTDSASSAQSGPDISYVVIYRDPGVNPEDIPGEASSALIDDRETHKLSEYDPVDNGAVKRLDSETGFVMRFTDADWQREMNALTIISLPGLASYPVSQVTLDSLPPVIKASLHKHGHAQFRGIYDRDSHTFSDARIGWERGDDMSIQAWIDWAINKFDISPTAATDYAMVALEDSEGDTRHTVDSWAETREVTTSAIEKSVGKVVKNVDDRYLSHTGKKIARSK